MRLFDRHGDTPMVTIEAVQQLIDTLSTQFDARINLFHDSLNERLTLKDRWITDRFLEVDKRLEDAMRHAESERQGLRTAVLAAREAADGEHRAIRQWFESRFDMGSKRFEDYVEFTRINTDQLFAAHLETHRVAEKGQEEFKGTVQDRLQVISKTIEVLREERGLFILRDSHDAQIDALERLIDSLERSMTDKLDAAIKQLRESHDSRITGNLDRLTKMEQNLQVMNARNQQSIIALGILLTLVEIIIRYYQRD
jgi:hypothetical protein